MRHAVRLLQTLIAYPTDIKMMINARHAAGIANTSNTTFNEYTGSQCNVLKTEGSYGTLYAVMGANADAQGTGGFTEILRGHNYRYLLRNSSNVVWVDLPSDAMTMCRRHAHRRQRPAGRTAGLIPPTEHCLPHRAARLQAEHS